MEDILYLAKKKVGIGDIISAARDSNYRWASVCAKSDSQEVRIIPFKDTYWDFSDFVGSPDFKCLEEPDLSIIRKYAPESIFLVTHSYDTRRALAKFLKMLVDRKGGGVVTNGDLNRIDDLSDMDSYITSHCNL
jgi:hypothetical protein